VKTHSTQSGFTLIEVVITIGILMTLTIAAASMMRNGFDVREGLSERAQVIHRLDVAITKTADDIQQTFYVSLKDAARNGIDRRMKTVFRLEKNAAAGSDRLSLTTMSHHAIKAGVHESDFTYVVYELHDSKDAPGRKDLYRGETPVIPEDLKDPVPMQLLAKNIKTFTIEYWRGDEWSKDRWDTNGGDTRNMLPKLVRITIEAWTRDRKEGDGQDESIDQSTESIGTVVYVTNAREYADLKDQSKTIRWDKL